MSGAIPLSPPVCLCNMDRDNFTVSFFTLYLKGGVGCELNRIGSLWRPVRLFDEALVSITTNILGHLNFWFLLRE
jgi:hypothetical protein